MKMVASAKLKRAQEKAESGRPYATKMSSIVSTLASKVNSESGPKLLFGNKENNRVLLVAISADRGLCGGFNNNISKEIRKRVNDLEKDNKEVKLILVGRKVGTVLKREMGDRIIGSFTGIQGDNLSFSKISPITLQIISLFEDDKIDCVEMYYNRFRSVISQVVTKKQLIPADVNTETPDNDEESTYEYEPEEEMILDHLLPRNLSTQIYSALLDSSAGELAARMTAMDNATRNAGELIDRLTLEYNRTRQAFITKELIEIISGAEAV
jgi:F-type H+-transporting ATPase subunit gamma